MQFSDDVPSYTKPIVAAVLCFLEQLMQAYLF